MGDAQTHDHSTGGAVSAAPADEAEGNTFETVATAIAVTAVLLICVLTSADACAAEAGVAADDNTECTEVKLANGKKEVRCGPVTVTGKVWLPGSLVIPRQKVEIPEKELDERHAPKIVEAARKEHL